MPRRRQHPLPILLSLAFLAAVMPAVAGDLIQLHPKGEALPFDHQGPFVATSDGKIVGITIARALRVTTYAVPADVVLEVSKKLLTAR